MMRRFILVVTTVLAVSLLLTGPIAIHAQLPEPVGSTVDQAIDTLDPDPIPPPHQSAGLAYAHVQADGTVDQDSGNVTVSKVGAGQYCVYVTGGTVHVAVASLDSLTNVGGTVQAGVFAASVCGGNPNDILVVTRPHAQDGGFPGADRAFYIMVN